MVDSENQIDRSTDDVRDRLIRVEEQVKGHIAFVTMQRELDQDAIRLQAGKYEDRLTNLNGEADRIADVQSESVSRELFNSEIKAMSLRVDELKTALDEQRGGRISRTDIVGAVVALAVVLSLVVAYFNIR